MCVCVCMCVFVSVYAYLCVYKHTYALTHIHTHTNKFVASHGGRIVYGVDATNLSATLGPIAGTIGRIVFNFPCLEAPPATAETGVERISVQSIDRYLKPLYFTVKHLVCLLY